MDILTGKEVNKNRSGDGWLIIEKKGKVKD
jgi:hypothetical protein